MKLQYTTIAMLGLLGSMAAPAAAANVHVERALAHQGQLSLFYQALLNTGVASELNENTEYAIFAPTNAAFAEIQPRVYPCFYATPCRAQVAALLRNHIVPINESVSRFSRWGGGIPTLGSRKLDVEEPYKGDFAVEGRKILYQDKGEEVSLYPIDGVIASNQELAPFRMPPVVDVAPGIVTEQTTTTYRTSLPPTSSVFTDGYMVPGGYPASPTVIYMVPTVPSQGDTTETTTITRTKTTE
jgi:uncharacterized surface protein with fasciclin (FAS1) repeats